MEPMQDPGTANILVEKSRNRRLENIGGSEYAKAMPRDFASFMNCSIINGFHFSTQFSFQI
jgi:hypothetical protein